MCPVVLDCPSRVKIHMKAVHGVGDAVKYRFKDACPDCGKVLTSKNLYFAHVFEVHGVELPGMGSFPCPDCGKMFYLKDAMSTHLASHSVGLGDKMIKVRPKNPFKTHAESNATRFRRTVEGWKGAGVEANNSISDPSLSSL